jgi:hypothetical protein
MAVHSFAAVPDTSNIPSKWKNESVIILRQRFNVSEDGRDEYKENIYCAYYIKDKYGLSKLSTLSIPNEIEAGTEVVIGKIYKKDNSVVNITGKYLTAINTKIGKGNKKDGEGSAVNYETSQKLAIPSLEVGDILEIEYTAKRKTFPTIISLTPRYPAISFEVSVKINDFSYSSYYYSGYQTRLYKKAVNFDESNMSSSDRSVEVKRDTVDKVREEILTDDNKTYPYLLLAKTYGTSTYESKTFESFRDDDLEQKQLAVVRDIYEKGDLEQKDLARNIRNMLRQKYGRFYDTTTFLNDLFYYYRETAAMGALMYNDGNKGYNDLFFVNVISRVLFDFRIPNYIFLTQPDYFGEPVNQAALVKPHYGIYVPAKNFYMFNPMLFTQPNQIPSYYEGQKHVRFKANKHYKPYRYFSSFWILPPVGLITLPLTLPPFIVNATLAKKHRKFGFTTAHFPQSDPEDNMVELTIGINDFNQKTQTCNFTVKSSYYGKHKNRFSKNLCSKTLIYENTISTYRKKKVYIDPAQNTKELNDKYLKSFLLNDLENDGYDVDKLKDYKLVESNFFDPYKPITTQCTFEAKNVFFAYDNYIILNVGTLLGNQLVNTSRDTVRYNDYSIPYKKIYTFKINIEVPAGYTVENLSSLNQKFSSNAGSFMSQAALKGNTIEITTQKTYNFQSYEKTLSKEVNGFLDQANEFSMKKLLLRKI